MPKHLRTLVSPQQLLHMDDLFSAVEKKKQTVKYISLPCVIRVRNIYLEEPFVLSESTWQCQNAFKWKSEPKRSRANFREVKGVGHAWCLSKNRFNNQREVRNERPWKFIKCLMLIIKQERRFWHFILFKQFFSSFFFWAHKHNSITLLLPRTHTRDRSNINFHYLELFSQFTD